MIDFRTSKNMTLGIRNNNPGNIRPSLVYKWNGEIGENKGFVIFNFVEYGIRALTMDLVNKHARGLDTIEKIINTYAPPSENNTKAYIRSVCLAMTTIMQEIFEPDMVIKLSADVLHAFVRAIINHENGASATAVTAKMIVEGANLIPLKMKKSIPGFPG